MSFKIVGIGELLWDLLPGGKKLGGAPANFVYHCTALGADAHLVSRVGNDDLGQEALKSLRSLEVSTSFVEIDPRLPTGTVGVELSADGQATYTIHESVAWDSIRAFEAYPLLAAADAFCFGTLAQRYPASENLIGLAVLEAKQAKYKILDINLRPPFCSRSVIERSLTKANVLKLNEHELPVLARQFNLRGDERAQILELASKFELLCVAFTRGAAGSLLWRAGEWSERSGTSVQVVDTVGAGDSFTAAMTLGLLAGWPLPLLHERASEVAAFVCTQSGATPALPEDLKAAFITL